MLTEAKSKAIDRVIKKIQDELKTMDYSAPVQIRGCMVWRFGKDEYAEIKDLLPDGFHIFGVHMKAHQMALHLYDK